MTMPSADITLEAARTMAEQAGLPLTDSELVELLTGIQRTKTMALAARTLLRDDLEPTPAFSANPVR